MPRMTFQFCALALASSVNLPELPDSDRPDPDIVFRVTSRQPPAAIGEPLHRWESADGALWLTISRCLGGYVLQFPDLATFFLAEDAKSLRCRPHPGTPTGSIRHLLLDQVMPLVLSRMGRVVLHGSAVATAGGVLAFAGESGQGKSTVADAFVRHGAELVSDDCLLLDEAGGAFRLVPSYPGLRLWPDVARAVPRGAVAVPVCHYSRKERLHQAIPFVREPRALRRLYLLANPADDISIAPIAPRDALIELVKSSFVLDITDPVSLRLSFETLSRLAALGLVYRLSYPHDLARLPELHAAIMRHAAAS